MPAKKTTLVLGASDNPSRYSYLAIKRLRSLGIPVVAIGKKESNIDDVHITKEKIAFENVDTVTLYMSEPHQKEYYDYIVSLKPARIIFNPGTENYELAQLAKKNNIKTMHACTLVMVSTGQY